MNSPILFYIVVSLLGGFLFWVAAETVDTLIETRNLCRKIAKKLGIEEDK